MTEEYSTQQMRLRRAQATLRRLLRKSNLNGFTLPEETNSPGFQIGMKKGNVLFDTISFIVPPESPKSFEIMLMKNGSPVEIRGIGYIDFIIRFHHIREFQTEIERLHDIISNDAEIKRVYAIFLKDEQERLGYDDFEEEKAE